MQIVTNSGKIFETEWVLDTQTRHGIQQLTIQFPGNIDLGAIIRELVGVEQIICVKENGNRTMYEGYKMFYSLIATPDRSAVRLTLERGD